MFGMRLCVQVGVANIARAKINERNWFATLGWTALAHGVCTEIIELTVC